MLNQYRTLTYCILVAASAIGLTGCSEKTTTSTQNNPDGSQTTTVTEQKGLNTKTTVTQTPADSVEDTDSTHAKTNIKFSIGKDTDDGASEVHVHGPGIKIDTADGEGKVDIKLPFVKVKKDSNGRVQVKTPFANIESNEN